MGMEQFGFNAHQTEPPRFNFENEGVEKRDRLTVDEIAGQLAVTATKYEDALETLKRGDDTDKEYLELYQANLVDWMNDIRITEGTLTRKNAEIMEEVEKRLFLISEELERTQNTLH